MSTKDQQSYKNKMTADIESKEGDWRLDLGAFNTLGTLSHS